MYAAFAIHTAYMADRLPTKSSADARGFHTKDAAADVSRTVRVAFALILAAAVAAHLGLLRFAYVLDETYFATAARDLYAAGRLIPVSVIPESHPPLVYAWLALCWKLFGFSIPVARTAMLAISLLLLGGTYRLGRQLVGGTLALAATALTALYPVVFMHSSMVHLDMAAAAFTLWALDAYLRGCILPASLLFCLAALSKETAIVAPAALLLAGFVLAWRDRARTSATPRRLEWLRRQLPMLLPFAALVLWFGYLYVSYGQVFGDQNYVNSNLGGMVHPLRAVQALIRHLWHLLGYLYMAVPVLAAASALLLVRPAVPQALPRPVLLLVIVAASHVLFLSFVGGAVLARYLLPVYPLVILAALQIVARRVRWWPAVVFVSAAAFIFGLFPANHYSFHREDNLACLDFATLQKSAIVYVSSHAAPGDRVASDHPEELAQPWLGYAQSPFPSSSIVDIDLTPEVLAAGIQPLPRYTIWTPLDACRFAPSAARAGWLHRYYFDHPVLSLPETAQALHAHVAYFAQGHCDMVAVLESDAPGPAPSATAN